MFDLFKSDKDKYVEFICSRSKYAVWVVSNLAVGVIPDVHDPELKKQLEIWVGLVDSYKELSPIDNLRQNFLKFEFLFIHLHLLDRIAFQQNMDHLKRDKFMRKIEQKAINTMLNDVFNYLSNDDKKEMKNDINKQFENSMVYYSQFKAMLPEQNESASGTLMWEFGKVIAESVEREYGASIISTSYVLVLNDIMRMKIMKFVQSQI